MPEKPTPMPDGVKVERDLIEKIVVEFPVERRDEMFEWLQANDGRLGRSGPKSTGPGKVDPGTQHWIVELPVLESEKADNTCKTCKWWSANCTPPNDAMVCNRQTYLKHKHGDVPNKGRPVQPDGFRVAVFPGGDQAQSVAAYFTGPDYGCIHHEPKA